ncbi:MAG: preprotein translocase subunit SecA [Candidatus Binatia bacterium]
MSKRILLGVLGGSALGAIVGGVIGLALGGAAAWERALLLGSIGLVVGAIGGAVAADPKRVFGSSNDRQLKRLRPLVSQVSKLEAAVEALSDDALRAKTDAFRARIAEATGTERAELARLRAKLNEQPEGDDEHDGEREGAREAVAKQEDALHRAEQAVLEEILPEAFACVREASRRTTGLRHYDVQILGGIVLHRGRIAEMKTGEGKTLVATLPIYLNALTGRGVHLVTVNDYLARRDVQWMGPIYHALGISCAAVVHETSFLFDPTYVVNDYRMLNLRPVERKAAYAADITYGTNHEFGFDYLRDNMKFSLDDYVQRELAFAIVDEVDNILIDEARTPLIISGPAEESTEKYYQIDRVVPRLRRGATTVGDVRQEDRAAIEAQGDYTVDEKARSVHLTESGVAKVERMLNVQNLYDPRHIDILHHVNQALRAHTLYKRDVHYIVKDGQVIIVDEFTGRLMPGRRWSDGLHQAVEAKEGVRIERENQTLATITIQNYFRMYKKLAGMTGTADTEAAEFKKIYKLDVTVIPPNRTQIRLDHPDVVYKSEREKFDAVVEQIVECHERQQPVLVGTISVEKSEHLSKMLKRRGVRHNVLNAVNHEAEANIIAQAGRQAAVTIATNMAGRGTDILLGGNPEFLARAEMENEWVRRTSNLPEGSLRYEEVLARLREQFDTSVEQARLTYEPQWAPLAEAQAKTLEDLTAAHRAFLDADFWHARTAYDEALEAAEDGGAAYEACAAAAVRYSEALQEIDRVTGPHFGEEGQQRFQHALAEWCGALRDSVTNGASAVLPNTRSAFERARQDYERAMHRVLGEPGDGRSSADALSAYQEALAAYQAAETAYGEARAPYEAAVTTARQTYETERRKYTKVIDDVREQMEAAPEELRGRYAEVLAKYRELCAVERQTVVDAGGLFILGTERHESRRIDNQLRGRAGRQGDPGASRFYLSLEDDLLRIFGAARIQGLMTRLGMEEGEPIEHRLITRAIANAQSKVEAHNFDVRKHLLEYDDVMNKQREVIYHQRREVLSGETLREQVWEMVDGAIEATVAQYARPDLPAAEWDWAAFEDAVVGQFNIRLRVPEEAREKMTPGGLEDALRDATRAAHAQREAAFTPPVMQQLEKFVLLQTIDQLWKEHLLSMDHLKEGIGLRGYGQRNPLQEYQKEGFAMFEEMIDRIHTEAVQKVFTVQAVRSDELERLEQRRMPTQMAMHGGGAPAPTARQNPAARPRAAASAAGGAAPRRDLPKVGRNDPCHCGSGKKFKKCHGA